MEKLMQYVWQHRLWKQSALRTVDGRVVQVIDPGRLNTDAGPDFFNAKVQIDGQMWSGNVEIHVKASDWFRHGHDHDRAYDSVVLHVVGADDASVSRPDGQTIPQMLMPCTGNLNQAFHELVDYSPAYLPCAATIRSLPSIYVTDWVATLGFERLNAKADRALLLLEQNAGDWEEVAYVTLARSLGFGLNSEPCERLARSLPLRMLRKHSDSQLSLEAFMFGQGGLIPPPHADEDVYTGQLREEYAFLANKFGLRPLEGLGWKLARTRPQNFPYRRLAMLAAMAADGFSLMSKLLSAKGAEEVKRQFQIEVRGYWGSHFTFGGTTTAEGTALGDSALTILAINVAAPLLYAYGLSLADESRMDSAVELLHEIKGERNSVVRLFTDAGIPCPDAFTSQALIELRREYCEQRKCLFCRIGHRLLAARVNP